MRRSAEKAEQNRMLLVGDRQRLDAELLANLQLLHRGRSLADVGVDDGAEPRRGRNESRRTLDRPPGILVEPTSHAC